VTESGCGLHGRSCHAQHGGIGIVHRNLTIVDQAGEIDR